MSALAHVRGQHSWQHYLPMCEDNAYVSTWTNAMMTHISTCTHAKIILMSALAQMRGDTQHVNSCTCDRILLMSARAPI
eukprot:3239426-Rhodomonas_salina.4